MNGRDIVSLLESEARRKPDIADMLERARSGNMTEEEIDSVPLPLPWFRKALKEARNRAVVMPDIDMVRLDDGANNGEGITVVYTGNTCWVKARRGFTIEVRTGDLLFFPREGGAWLNQTFFDKPPQEFKTFKVVEEQTRQKYVDTYLSRLMSRA